MALTLDTTVGGASSNSYAAIAEGDVFFESVLSFFDLWTGFTSAQKTARLMEAARGIDRLRDRFDGDKVDLDQALEFPRNIQDDPLVIPTGVKNAQLHMVIYFYANPALTVSGTTLTSNSEGAQELASVGALNGLVNVAFSARRTDDSVTAKQAKDGSLEAVLAELAPFFRAGVGSNFGFIK